MTNLAKLKATVAAKQEPVTRPWLYGLEHAAPELWNHCNGCRYTFKALPGGDVDMADFRRHKAECGTSGKRPDMDNG